MTKKKRIEDYVKGKEERRVYSYTCHIPERRSGKDRRKEDKRAA